MFWRLFFTIPMALPGLTVIWATAREGLSPVGALLAFGLPAGTWFVLAGGKAKNASPPCPPADSPPRSPAKETG